MDDQTWTGRQRRWCGTKRHGSREETRRMMSGNFIIGETRRGDDETRRRVGVRHRGAPSGTLHSIDARHYTTFLGCSGTLTGESGETRTEAKRDDKKRRGWHRYLDTSHVRLLGVKESLAATASLAVGDLRQQPTAGMSEMTGAKESSVVAIKVSL
ncbi:hypothetical protein CPLU01_01001 [Colletotrichum plurivorum]|uniref:Uncharacterized protein n=1 Tax=Colletotrichum plurivorum TaxID=2175906 RepID=A0A8H6U5F9_9PEZI|nr:hypothetical protein CPLU01_01001 [Colletotrichum plurivorum]